MGLFNLIDVDSPDSLYRKQYNETKALTAKWKRSGLLEGIEDEYTLHGMAMLLENQAKQLIKEASKTGIGPGAEEWSGVALPLVRRIFTEIAAKEFVSVQPMNLPSGLIFYMDFKYGTNQPGFSSSETTTGTTRENWQSNTIHGVTSTDGDVRGGLYGDGRFGYTINDIASASLSCTVVSGTYADVAYNPQLSQSVKDDQIKKVTVSLVNHDIEGVRAFYVSGTLHSYYPAYTLPVDENGAASTTKVTFVVSASATPSDVLVRYHVQPSAENRGDFEAQGDYISVSNSGQSPNYYDPAKVLDIPEINLNMRSEPIVAKTHKLKAVWTPEFAQDINAYHSIDAEKVLASTLSEYVSMEVDLEILDMLILNAITTDYWSAKVGAAWLGTTTNGEADFGPQSINVSSVALQYSQNEWFKTLGTKVQKVSNKIHQKTMRGGANFIVCSPDVSTILESIPGYAVDTDGDKQQYAMGVQKVGMINNRFTVYKNPYMTGNILLMGFRGSQFLETGAVYAPYIPLIQTPLVYDPVNFTPRMGVMTRFAKKVVRPEFYGKILISHLNYV